MTSTRPLTPEETATFERDGFVVVPALFDREEVDLLSRAAREQQALPAATRTIADGDGGRVQLNLWNDAGDDIFGRVGRSHRVVDALEQLLGGEVYHYHSKMSMKQPFEGGVWEWHQDYGYWYHNACLFPLMASCFIAIDANTRENGCMQVLRGSHHMGRLEHGTTGGQTGADPDRVAQAMKVLDLVHVELEPGDALFFHCNLLHRSDANRSPHPRWSLICCYNAARNNPFAETGHPRYTKLEKVDDGSIREMSRAV